MSANSEELQIADMVSAMHLAIITVLVMKLGGEAIVDIHDIGAIENHHLDLTLEDEENSALRLVFVLDEEELDQG